VGSATVLLDMALLQRRVMNGSADHSDIGSVTAGWVV